MLIRNFWDTLYRFNYYHRLVKFVNSTTAVVNCVLPIKYT